MKERDLVTQKTQEKVDAAFEYFSIDESQKVIVKSCNVGYQELAVELDRLIKLTKQGKRFETYHSLFIYGPTGVGKCCCADTKIVIDIDENVLKNSEIEYEEV